MLISPQHLQQLDQYHETLLEERLTSVVPYATGVYALEVAFDSDAQKQVRSFVVSGEFYLSGE